MKKLKKILNINSKGRPNWDIIGNIICQQNQLIDNQNEIIDIVSPGGYLEELTGCELKQDKTLDDKLEEIFNKYNSKMSDCKTLKDYDENKKEAIKKIKELYEKKT